MTEIRLDQNAAAVCVPIYGKENIERQKPY